MKNSNNSNRSDSDKVISLIQYREKKDIESNLSRGRNPLYVSHLNGKIKGSPHLSRPSAENFGDRLHRIRQSLEKINRLMAELKKLAVQDNAKIVENKSNISNISPQKL